MPDEYVHEPHHMIRGEQEAPGCIFGIDYPKPIVDLGMTYDRVQRMRDESG